MSDLYELSHPSGKFSVKVTAERRSVLRARGYQDVGTTAAAPVRATVDPVVRKPVASKPAAKPAKKPTARK